MGKITFADVHCPRDIGLRDGVLKIRFAIFDDLHEQVARTLWLFFCFERFQDFTRQQEQIGFLHDGGTVLEFRQNFSGQVCERFRRRTAEFRSSRG